ncbi:hypothetical protein GFS24_11250 [Chitinophaga sp. SYP-B3965]|nr:hypothetical protein [Chitinophaga sp. SYP-B3965]
MTRKSFLFAFIIAGIFNVSYGQAKVNKLDKLISTYAEYGQFNGAVLVAEKVLNEIIFLINLNALV